MEREHKPIKRSAQLAPLSREHHQGLLLGFKLRQGMKYGVEAARMAAFARWFWAVHLLPHFKKEEACLPPLLPPGDPLIAQMLAEHQAIKSKIELIRDDASHAVFEDLVEAVTQHIRFEERVLFGEVEKNATDAQLTWLADQLADNANRAEWHDPFWTYKK